MEKTVIIAFAVGCRPDELSSELLNLVCNGIYIAIGFGFKQNVGGDLVDVADGFEIEAVGQTIARLLF